MNARSAGLGLALVLVVSACGGTAAPASPSAATASPAAAATGAPSAAPTAAPTRALDHDQAAAADALEAFSALVRDVALTFRMDQTGSITTLSSSQDFTYAIDVAGSDFSAVISVAGSTIELRAVGDTAYTRVADGAWASAPLDPASTADVLNPWQYLGEFNDLVFVSRAPQKMEAFQFANSGPIDYQTTKMRASGAKGVISSLNFVVMPDGTPVELRFAAEAPDGQGGTAKMSSVVSFSKVGEPLTIERPK